MRSGDLETWAREFVRVNSGNVVSAEEDRDLDLADEDDYITERDVAVWLELALETGRRQGREYRPTTRESPKPPHTPLSPMQKLGRTQMMFASYGVNEEEDPIRRAMRREVANSAPPPRVRLHLHRSSEQALPAGDYTFRITDVMMQSYPIDTGLSHPFGVEVPGEVECRVEGFLYPGSGQ